MITVKYGIIFFISFFVASFLSNIKTFDQQYLLIGLILYVGCRDLMKRDINEH